MNTLTTKAKESGSCCFRYPRNIQLCLSSFHINDGAQISDMTCYLNNFEDERIYYPIFNAGI